MPPRDRLHVSWVVCLLLATGCPPADPDPEGGHAFGPARDRRGREQARESRQSLERALAGLAEPAGDARGALAVLAGLPAETLAPEAGRVSAALEQAIARERLRLLEAEELLARLGPDGLALLAEGLSTPEAEGRRRLARRLAAGGPPGLRLLIARLASGPELVGDAEVLSAARQGLAGLAGAEEVASRLTAAELLARLVESSGQADELGPLAGLLGDPVAEVRLAAVEALTGLGSRAAPRAETLAGLLRDPDPGVRAVTGDLLHRLGQGVVPPLGRLLAEADEDARAAAAGVLGRVGEPALEVLLGHRDAAPRVRVAVLQALASQPSARVWPALEAGLQDEHGRVRQEVIRALAGREDDPKAVELLGKALGEQEPLLLRSALESLERLGAQAAPAAARIRQLAKSGPAEVRLEALSVLTRVQKDPRALLVDLDDLMSSGDANVRLRVVELVGALGPPAGSLAPRLKELATRDPDDRVKQAALLATFELTQAPAGGGAGFG
jgi:HEAT repeat protein